MKLGITSMESQVTWSMLWIGRSQTGYRKLDKVRESVRKYEKVWESANKCYNCYYNYECYCWPGEKSIVKGPRVWFPGPEDQGTKGSGVSLTNTDYLIVEERWRSSMILSKITQAFHSVSFFIVIFFFQETLNPRNYHWQPLDSSEKLTKWSY